MRLLQNDRVSIFGHIYKYAPSTSPSILSLTKNLRRDSRLYILRNTSETACLGVGHVCKYTPSSSHLFPVSCIKIFCANSLVYFPSPLASTNSSLLEFVDAAENLQKCEHFCRTSDAYFRMSGIRFSVTYIGTRPQPHPPFFV